MVVMVDNRSGACVRGVGFQFGDEVEVEVIFSETGLLSMNFLLSLIF
jgi:hypothetical protein